MTLTQHVVVGVIRNGVDVWGHFRLSLALVAADNVVVIDGKPLVGVDSDTEKTRVGVDQESNVTFGQVVHNRGLNKQVIDVFHIQKLPLL